MGWTGLPNPLFCSLLESATKPIDKDEEESYRAAFAGEQKGFAGKLICSPSVWLEPQWSDLAGLPSGGKRDLVIWNSHIGADIIGSTHSNQKTLNWTKRLIEPYIQISLLITFTLGTRPLWGEQEPTRLMSRSRILSTGRDSCWNDLDEVRNLQANRSTTTEMWTRYVWGLIGSMNMIT